eukprot:m.71233 g.71233  ORF g.71233 m.71233 type:complete len:1509 (-) comp8340_c0_seq1:255-4781(-)
MRDCFYPLQQSVSFVFLFIFFIILPADLVLRILAQQQCVNSNIALARLGMYSTCDTITPSLCESRDNVKRACPQQCNLDFCTKLIPFDYVAPQGDIFFFQPLIFENGTLCEEWGTPTSCEESHLCRWVRNKGGTEACEKREVPAGFDCFLSSMFECPSLPECDLVGFQCFPKFNEEILKFAFTTVRGQTWSLPLNQPYGNPVEVSTLTKLLMGRSSTIPLLPEERKAAISSLLIESAHLLQNITQNGMDLERSWVWDGPIGGYCAYFTTETFIHSDNFTSKYLQSDFSVSVRLKPSPRATTYLPPIGEDIYGRHLYFQNRFFLPPIASVVNHDLLHSSSKFDEDNILNSNKHYSAIGFSIGTNGIVVYELFLVEDPDDVDNNGIFTRPSIVSRLTLPLNLEGKWTFVAIESRNNQLRLVINSTISWDIPTVPGNLLRVVPYVGASYFGAYHGKAVRLLFTNDGTVPSLQHIQNKIKQETFEKLAIENLVALNGTIDDASKQCDVCTVGIYKEFLNNIWGVPDEDLFRFNSPQPYKTTPEGRQLFEFEQSIPSNHIPTIHVTRNVPFAIGNIMDSDIESKWISFSFVSDLIHDEPVHIDDQYRFRMVIKEESETFHFLFRVNFNLTDSSGLPEISARQYYVTIIVHPQLQLRVRPNKKLLLSSLLFSDSYSVEEHLEVIGGLAPFHLSCDDSQCTIRQDAEIVTISNSRSDTMGYDRSAEVVDISRLINTTNDQSFDILNFVPDVSLQSRVTSNGVTYVGDVVALHLRVTDAIGNVATTMMLKFNVNPTTFHFPTTEVVVNEQFVYMLPHSHASTYLDHESGLGGVPSTSTSTPMTHASISFAWYNLTQFPAGVAVVDNYIIGKVAQMGFYSVLMYTFTDTHNNAAFVGNFSFSVKDPLRVATVVDTSCVPVSPSYDAAHELSGEGRLYTIQCGDSQTCDIFLTVQSYGGDEVQDVIVSASGNVAITANVIVSYTGYKCYLATIDFQEPNMRSLVSIEYFSINGVRRSENVTYIETMTDVIVEQSTQNLSQDAKVGIAAFIIILAVLVLIVVIYYRTLSNGRVDIFSEFGIDFTNLKRPQEYNTSHFTKINRLPLFTTNEHEVAFKGVFKDRQMLFCTIIKLDPVASHIERKRFYNAAVVMATLRNHENVTQLFGVVGVKNGALYKLIDFNQKCTLDRILRSQSDIFRLPLDKRMSILNQVASGLNHVHDQGFAHRNICAKSVLYDSKAGDCKLFGFEYAKYYKKNDSLAVEHTTSLDIRWSALEVLRDNLFMFESDIWSFGVFMYEVFSEGSMPYSELKQESDVMDFLIKGNRLPTPFGCNEKIHNCMLRCWMAAEKKRPSLKELIKCFTTIEEISRIEIAKNSLTGDCALFSRIPNIPLLQSIPREELRRNSVSSIGLGTPAMRSVLHGVDDHEKNVYSLIHKSNSDADYWGDMYFDQKPTANDDEESKRNSLHRSSGNSVQNAPTLLQESYRSGNNHTSPLNSNRFNGVKQSYSFDNDIQNASSIV